MSFSRIKKISKQGTLFNNLLLRSKECYYCRSYDIFENQEKDIKESSLLLGSCRRFTKRYNNYAEVTFDVFSLSKSSGGLSSQNHTE